MPTAMPGEPNYPQIQVKSLREDLNIAYECYKIIHPKREPSILEFIDYCSKILGSESFLWIRVDLDGVKNIKFFGEAFLNILRVKKSELERKVKRDLFRDKRFTKKLDRYLKLYKFHAGIEEKRKSYREILKLIPEYIAKSKDNIESESLMKEIQRDKKIAKKFIEMAEQGNFPGLSRDRRGRLLFF